MPPNPNDPCARAGRDTCGTAGTGFYSVSSYGLRWFGDYRGAVVGQAHAFCIDLGFWYASRAYRYREDSSAVLDNRDGAKVAPEKQEMMAYALWRYGRSARPSRQAAVMLSVHSLMGDARPGEIDPEALSPRVAAFYRTIARAARREHGPYRIEASLPNKLVVGKTTTASVRVLSASGHALTQTGLSLSARGAEVPSEMRTDGTGRAAIMLKPTAVDVQLRLATAPLAPSRPRIFVPSTAAAAANGQRLAVADGDRVTAVVSRRARPVLATVASRQIVRAGARIFDRIRVLGLDTGTASIEVELFGPFASRATISCTGRPYWRRLLTVPGESEIRSPPVRLARAGFYAYREQLVGPGSIARAPTACDLAAETTLAAPQIVTGRGDLAAAIRTRGIGNRTPARLRIPALGISAPVVPVGIDVEHGVLGLPTSIRRTGWWQDGMAPGTRAGAILIAGHVDSATAGPGAFFALQHARAGERVQVTTAAGRLYTYRVVSVRSYPKRALPTTVYARDGTPRLVLVTCGGRFDRASRHYPDNIVVTAIPA